jgi:Rod binding domain-containing protein
MADLKLIAPATAGGSLNSLAPLHNLQTDARSDDSKKIDKSAHDFESILVGQWLEKAEKSFATVPGVDPNAQSDPGHDQLQSIAMQALSQNLTKSGGFGIAAMLIKQLQARATHAGDDHNKDDGTTTKLPEKPALTKLQK